MNNKYEPDGRFVEKLEWQLSSEYRRTNRMKSAPGKIAVSRRMAGIAALVGLVMTGLTVINAVAFLKDSWRKKIEIARVETEVKLKQAHLPCLMRLSEKDIGSRSQKVNPQKNGRSRKGIKSSPAILAIAEEATIVPVAFFDFPAASYETAVSLLCEDRRGPMITEIRTVGRACFAAIFLTSITSRMYHFLAKRSPFVMFNVT